MPPDLSKLTDLPALKQLARALWHNRSIRGAALMVGAGFSKSAILQAPDTQEAPSWNELLDELVTQLYPNPEDQWSAPKDSLRIAEEYRNYFGQAALDGYIRTRFPDRAWLPGSLHLQALNFPWSDILTTNWDTLLERAKDEVTGIIYEVVRIEADIAHARGPRIVKLHGTLGDKDPLIFTAEDFRTYPVRHAVFLNLARQIFIENDLCLLGFSGNDPNFLEWAGWVRDQLGGNARRIYLAGYLSLSVSARKYLEALNISPIDFSSMVNKLPKRERYAAATKIFLDALQAERPPAPHEWQRHAIDEFPQWQGRPEIHHKLRSDTSFATEVLKATARLLRDDRKNYPGWLVCPRDERSRSRIDYSEWAIFKPEVLAQLEPSELTEVIDEFLWRYTTTLSNIPEIFRDALVAIVDEPNRLFDQGMRLKVAVALMRIARIERNDRDFKRWSAIADAVAGADAGERLEAQYQRCLHLRDELDLTELTKSLKLLNSNDPLWQLRQAGLYAEVGHYEKATKLINDATVEFEKAHRLDRNSMWTKSCLAWASWSSYAAELGKSHLPGERTMVHEFRNDKIDPAGEFEAIENDADALRRKAQEDDAEIIPLFDAGSYRRGGEKALAELGDDGFLCLDQLDHLIEITGAPLHINHAQHAAGAAMSIMRVTHQHSVQWYVWLLRSLHSHFEYPFIRYFGRMAIAQLPQDIADQLRQKLDRAIAFWRNRVSVSIGEEYANDRSVAVDELRLALVAQSHMTVRMTVDEAAQAFQLGASICRDTALSYHWISEAAGELSKYALEAMPTDRRARLALDIIRYPLAAECRGHAPTWPDLIQVVAAIGPHRDDQDTRWDQRILELLTMAVPNALGRSEAINRLTYLASHDVLKPSEQANFAAALWDKVDDGNPPLPADTMLLVSAVAKLPAPEGIDPIDRVKARIFDPDLTDVMEFTDLLDTRVLSKRENHLISLYNTAPLGLSMTAERAAALFDQVVAWLPRAISNNDPMRASFEKRFSGNIKKWGSEALTFAIVPAMAKADKGEKRLSALLNFIDRTGSWLAIAALPNFLETVPLLQDRVVHVIHRGLAASEYFRIQGAVKAILRWSQLVNAHVLTAVPRNLIDQLISTIEVQKEDGLHIFLNAAGTLATNATITEVDMARLTHILSDLRETTKYSGILLDSRRAVSISLVRQQCVRLAGLLKQKISDNEILDRWLEEGRSDPLPEVRFSAQTT